MNFRRLFGLTWMVVQLTFLCLSTESKAALMAHWTFDETSGTIAHDSAGSYHGTLVGDATWSSAGGISGGAISLARATGGYVNMGNVLPLTGTDFSLVIWVKTTAENNNFLSKHQSGVVAGYILSNNDSGSYGMADKAWFYGRGEPWLAPISSTTVNDGDWHQVVVTYVQGGNASIYVDGAPVEDFHPSAAILDTAAPFLIGGLTDGPACDGLIDDVQVYSHALTDPEIQWLYDHPGQTLSCTPTPSGLVSWWRAENNFDDAYGGNNGTGQNGTTFATGKVSQAFKFDGVDDYVAIPNGLIPNTSRFFSVDAWVYPTMLDNNGHMIVYGGATAGEYELLIDDNNNFRFGIKLDDGNWYTVTSPATANAWTHIVGLRRGTSIELWVNNVLESSLIVPDRDLAATGNNMNNSRLGAYNEFTTQHKSYWNGLIDEVTFFNSALSSDQIAAIYHAGSMGKCRLPDDISGLRLWLRADSGVITGGSDNVLTWEDRSGNGLDVAQITEANRPTRLAADLNGMPVVRFDGVNDYLIREAVPGSDLFDNNADTVFIVQKQSGAKNETTTFSWASDGSNRFMVHATWRDVIYYQVGSNAGGGYLLAAPQPYGWDDRWHLLKLRRDGVGASGLIAVDGIGLTPTINNFSPGNNLPAADFYVGSDGLGFNWFQGDMAEILVFNRALTAQEQQTVEGYLRSKYGLTNTPNSFSFTDKTGQPFDTVIESDPITVTGINLLAPISISAGGEYSINGSPPVSTPGIVKNGDLVRVYVRSSDAPATTTGATLTIGGVSDTFSVTTRGLLYLPLILKG